MEELKLIELKNEILHEIKKKYCKYDWDCENIELAIVYTIKKLKGGKNQNGNDKGKSKGV